MQCLYFVFTWWGQQCQQILNYLFVIGLKMTKNVAKVEGL